MLVYSRNGNPSIKGEGGEAEAILKHSVENHMGCWLWTANVNDSGYGMISANGKYERVHRISYRVFNGEIPKGLLVRHLCHTRLCCNPDHLEVGTDHDNWMDMVVDGHTRLLEQDGSDNHMSKLTEEQVYEIREKYKSGIYRTKDLAGRYGVSRRVIERTVSGVAYSCYTDVPPYDWRDLDVDIFMGRLTRKGVQTIRKLLAGGYTQKEVVAMTNFTKGMVSNVSLNKYKGL